MSDPRRLVEGDELARMLIQSAGDDKPSPEGRARARSATLSAAAIGAGASLGLATSGAKAAGKVGGWVLLKWVAVGSVPAAFVVSAVTPVSEPRTPPASSAAASAPPRASMDRAAGSPRPTWAALSAEPAPPVTPPSQLSAAEIPKKSLAMGASRSSGSSLQAEITELDAARHALARGDGSVLDRYLAEYPRGALRDQALWMKIASYEQANRKAEARALAQRLLASYPRGAFAARARALLQP